jgi:hypothetical protein
VPLITAPATLAETPANAATSAKVENRPSLLRSLILVLLGKKIAFPEIFGLTRVKGKSKADLALG